MNTIRKIIKERNPKAILLSDIFDRALIGTAQACGGKTVAAYDSNVCIEILTDEQGFDELAALHYYENTVEHSKSGLHKPIFLSDFRKISPVRLEIDDTSTTIDKLFDLPKS